MTGQRAQNTDIPQNTRHKCFGGRAALTWEADTTRNDEPTLEVQAADSNGNGTYNWQERLTFQFTLQELPGLAATALGIRSELALQGHGPQNDKWFGMAWQSRADYPLVVRMGSREVTAKAVPLVRADGFYIGGMAVRAIRLYQPWLDGAALSTMLRGLYRE